jgi:hypothetical protein
MARNGINVFCEWWSVVHACLVKGRLVAGKIAQDPKTGQNSEVLK